MHASHIISIIYYASFSNSSLPFAHLKWWKLFGCTYVLFYNFIDISLVGLQIFICKSDMELPLWMDKKCKTKVWLCHWLTAINAWQIWCYYDWLTPNGEEYSYMLPWWIDNMWSQCPLFFISAIMHLRLLQYINQQ